MKCSAFLTAALAIFFFAASHATYAHHGTAGYDMQKVITVKGTVTEFQWTNPHCVIYVDSKADNGDVQHWVLELGAPQHMIRSGWTKSSVKAGDDIAAETHPAKNGATVGTTGMQSSVLKVVVNGVALSTK
jgi:Family of unknown function (DUF6152)